MLVRRRELNRLLPRHARRHSLDQTGFIRQQTDSPEQLPFKVKYQSAASGCSALHCMLTCVHCTSEADVVPSDWSEHSLLPCLCPDRRHLQHGPTRSCKSMQGMTSPRCGPEQATAGATDAFAPPELPPRRLTVVEPPMDVHANAATGYSQLGRPHQVP